MKIYLVNKCFKTKNYVNQTGIIKCYESKKRAMEVAYEHNVCKLYGFDNFDLLFEFVDSSGSSDLSDPNEKYLNNIKLAHKNVMMELLAQTNRDYKLYPKIDIMTSDTEMQNLLEKSISEHVDDYWKVIGLDVCSQRLNFFII